MKDKCVCPKNIKLIKGKCIKKKVNNFKINRKIDIINFR